MSTYNRKYYDPAKAIERNRLYRMNNREKMREYWRAWYIANKKRRQRYLRDTMRARRVKEKAAKDGK